MKVETTLVSVSRGDVFKYTGEFAYGRRALLIVDTDANTATDSINFVSCSSVRWCGNIQWLDGLLKSGEIIYWGTINNITNNQ